MQQSRFKLDIVRYVVAKISYYYQIQELPRKAEVREVFKKRLEKHLSGMTLAELILS